MHGVHDIKGVEAATDKGQLLDKIYRPMEKHLWMHFGIVKVELVMSIDTGGVNEIRPVLWNINLNRVRVLENEESIPRRIVAQIFEFTHTISRVSPSAKNHRNWCTFYQSRLEKFWWSNLLRLLVRAGARRLELHPIKVLGGRDDLLRIKS